MNGILDKKIQEIRDLINKPRKQSALLKDRVLWHMLCSSLDAIQDTELGLDALPMKEFDGTNPGLKYLVLYGALQALSIQQKAVKHLCESLKIPYTADSALDGIQQIYYDSVGHPTKRETEKGEAFNFISRATLTFQGFELMTTYSDETTTDFKNVNIPDLTDMQKHVFVDVLDNVIETLRREEMEHRKKFANKKLTSAFQQTTYAFEKIFDVIFNPESGHAQLADHYVNTVLESIKNFRDRLKEREEPDESYIYDNLDYSLQHLKAYFCKSNETHINERDAYIFADFAQRQVQGLENLARDLDEDYNE